MARIRYIKPEFFLDEDLANLSPLHRILFAGLWTLADREGRLEDAPRRIQVQVLPYDQCNIEDMLTDLCAGFIARYSVKGKKYIQIINFSKHQKPHPHESKSKILPMNRKDVITSRDMSRQEITEGGVVPPPCSRSIPPHVAFNGDFNGDGDGDRNGEGEGVIGAPAPKPKTSIQRTVEAYKHAKGVPMDDKGWDRANFGRYSKSAKSLLECFAGDVDISAAYIFTRATDFDEKGISWTLETIARHAWDGEGIAKEKESGREREPLESDRVLGQRGFRRLASSREIVGDTLRAIESTALHAKESPDMAEHPDDPFGGGESV